MTLLEKVKYWCLALIIYIAISPVQNQAIDDVNKTFQLQYLWSQLEFAYDNNFTRQQDINSGLYDPKIIAPMDVDVYYGKTGADRKVFVTIPRLLGTSPVTLGYITSNKINGNSIIKPFPNWSWHQPVCGLNKLLSVSRIKIDECGRIWVLDTGIFGDNLKCPPKILAFMTNGLLVHVFTIAAELIEPRSILTTLNVDVRKADCSNTFVYLADSQTYSIIVVDIKNNRAWKATDKTMYPYPNNGTYKIQENQFESMDGILGMDLEPYRGSGHNRKLFYHAMSATTENWVYTKDLRNEAQFEYPLSSPEIFHTYDSRRPSQASAQAIDKNGIAYFGLISETSINCWNTASSDYGKYIETLVRDPVTMQFASGVKVINNKKNQELWVLTSRFQKILTNTLNTTEPNFRIFTYKIDGSSCKYPGGAGTL